MLRVITCNVNGIRSAVGKGFWQWLVRQRADVICLQEVRAFEEQVPEPMRSSKGYHSFYVAAERPGYSGVAILSKHEPDRVITSLDSRQFDPEGRFVQIDLRDLSVASVYFPSGSASEVRQEVKYEFLDVFLDRAKRFRRQRRSFILCGDYNIAHKQIDIKNWKSNQKNSGFLPEERAWMDTLIDNVGLVDAFRVVNQKEEQYTWWSNRGQAYAKNVGWRIDYQIVTPELEESVKKAEIYKKKKFSDHAPLIIDYATDLT